jgi:hypothetical protein
LNKPNQGNTYFICTTSGIIKVTGDDVERISSIKIANALLQDDKHVYCAVHMSDDTSGGYLGYMDFEKLE